MDRKLQARLISSFATAPRAVSPEKVSGREDGIAGVKDVEVKKPEGKSDREHILSAFKGLKIE